MWTQSHIYRASVFFFGYDKQSDVLLDTLVTTLKLVSSCPHCLVPTVGRPKEHDTYSHPSRK